MFSVSYQPASIDSKDKHSFQMCVDICVIDTCVLPSWHKTWHISLFFTSGEQRFPNSIQTKQRRIELLNLPPNKANVEEFSWELYDFKKLRDRVGIIEYYLKLLDLAQ